MKKNRKKTQKRFKYVVFIIATVSVDILFSFNIKQASVDINTTNNISIEQTTVE